MRKVFLGGTCHTSTWRDELIPQLKIDYFNPVVPRWTPECIEEELKQREECDLCLYLITNDMVGQYSIAEAVDDSNKRPKKTIFTFIPEGMSNHQIKSMNQVGELIRNNGGLYLDLTNYPPYSDTLIKKLAEYLNML